MYSDLRTQEVEGKFKDMMAEYRESRDTSVLYSDEFYNLFCELGRRSLTSYRRTDYACYIDEVVHNLFIGFTKTLMNMDEDKNIDMPYFYISRMTKINFLKLKYRLIEKNTYISFKADDDMETSIMSVEEEYMWSSNVLVELDRIRKYLRERLIYDRFGKYLWCVLIASTMNISLTPFIKDRGSSLVLNYLAGRLKAAR